MLVTTVRPQKTPPISTHDEEDTRSRSNKSFCSCRFLVLLAFLLCLSSLDLALHLARRQEVQELASQVAMLEEDLEMVLESLQPISSSDHARNRRQVEDPHNLNEDGVPVVSASYAGNDDHNTEGLRIYDAFFLNENQIPQHDRSLPRARESGAPIRPHHRQSASWVEHGSTSHHDTNPHFEDKVFRESYPRASKTSHHGASMEMSRVKFTPEDSDSSYSSKVIGRETSRTSSSSGSSSSSSGSGGSFGHESVVAGGQDDARFSRNRAAVRSGGMRTRLRSLKRSHHRQFSGLKSVHFVADYAGQVVSGVGQGVVRSDDGVFRNWKPARWASRMGEGIGGGTDSSSSSGEASPSAAAATTFSMDLQGRMTIDEAGVYLIYAQVAYLDPHDVNSFQVLANSDPFLMCTAMTHTPHGSTTKANTCYTSGVRFMEKGDTVTVKDLEAGRHSVRLPAHTFFGAVQIARFTGGDSNNNN